MTTGIKITGDGIFLYYPYVYIFYRLNFSTPKKQQRMLPSC